MRSLLKSPWQHLAAPQCRPSCHAPKLFRQQSFQSSLRHLVHVQLIVGFLKRLGSIVHGCEDSGVGVSPFQGLPLHLNGRQRSINLLQLAVVPERRRDCPTQRQLFGFVKKFANVCSGHWNWFLVAGMQKATWDKNAFPLKIILHNTAYNYASQYFFTSV